MSEVRIAAEPRTEFGKGAARRVRRANKVPAVLHGHGDQPRHFSLPGHELLLALRKDPNVLLALQTDEGEQLALPKVVVRDPIKGFLEHVDLVSVSRGEKVTVEVPVTMTGEAGGDTLVDQQQATVTVEVDATNIPDHLEVSVQDLEVGAHVTADDVVLPEGVTLAEAGEDVLVQGLATPTAEQIDAELAASDEETGAGQSTGPTSETGEVSSGSDVDAGAGTGDVVPETEGARGGPDSSPSDSGASGATTTSASS